MTKEIDIVRCIHSSDYHWDTKNYKTLDVELREGLLKFIETDGDDYDVLIIEGDYFHDKLHLNDNATKAAIKFMYDLVVLCTQKNIKIRIIRGTKSHDYDQLENFRSYEKYYDFKIFNSVDIEELFPEFFVLYLPEEYMENQDKYYEEYFELEDGAKYDMITFHGTFDFAAFQSQKQESERQISNSAVFNSKQMLDICHGLIIGGHIHQRQKYKKRIVYNGSYSTNGFDEYGGHGFTVSEQRISTGEVNWEWVDNELRPEYTTLEPDDDFSDYDFESKMRILDDIMEEGDFVRLRLSATVFETITELMMFKEKASSIKDLKLEITDSNLIDIKKAKDSKKIEDIIEEKEQENPYAFITKEDNDIFVNVQKYIDVKNNETLDLSIIKDIMIDSKA